MKPQVQSLANLMKDRMQAGEKFVLMLGAGASIGAGVKTTNQLMEQLLQDFPDITGNTLLDRFDRLWARSTTDDRRRFLEKHLKPQLRVGPSPGYTKLARLIQAGYFDVVLSFNFDLLLEGALRGIDFADFKTIIRGETQDDAMQKLLDAREPRFKLTKMHGSLQSTDHFLFDAGEMHQYPPVIETMMRTMTSKDIIVCGYAFNDPCVWRAFAGQGGSVVWVNPGEAPRDFRVVMKNRRSDDWVIPENSENFFSDLHRVLLEAPAAATPKPVHNPFKFLESYEESDAGSLLLRTDETSRFLRLLGRDPPPQAVILWGPGKSGKTSLVKAALLPALESDKCLSAYVRCKVDLEKSLPSDLARLGVGSPQADMTDSLRSLGKDSPGRRVVLFLDQFERVTSRFARSSAGRADRAAFLGKQLLSGCSERATFVLVVTDESGLGAELLETCRSLDIRADLFQCEPFERQSVMEIVQALARKGEIEFDSRILDELVALYEETRNSQNPAMRFTLAHIQAVCHMLAGKRHVDYESYRTAFNQNRQALDEAINVCNIINFVEDFGWPDVAWFRNIIKVPLKESKEQIARFITANYEDLLPPPRPVSRARRGGDAAAGEVRVQ